MTNFQRWRDSIILREKETVGPEPERSDLNSTGALDDRQWTYTGPWTPAALDRLLADVQASPATAEIDRYLLKRMSEKHATAQLAVHGLRAHNNGLVADLAIARAANVQLARDREALWLEVARLSQPWWRRAWEWAAEFVAVVVKARAGGEIRG